MTKFRSGQSGNPAGKPRGVKSKLTRLREGLEKDLPALLDKTKEMALAGDTTAMRLLLERTLPPQRASTAPVRIDGLADTPTLTGKAQIIVEAVGAGELAPDVGTALLAALGSVAKITEIDELARRISVLEDMRE